MESNKKPHEQLMLLLLCSGTGLERIRDAVLRHVQPTLRLLSGMPRVLVAGAKGSSRQSGCFT